MEEIKSWNLQDPIWNKVPPAFSMLDTYSHPSFIDGSRADSFPFVLSFEALFLSTSVQ